MRAALTSLVLLAIVSCREGTAPVVADRGGHGEPRPHATNEPEPATIEPPPASIEPLATAVAAPPTATATAHATPAPTAPPVAEGPCPADMVEVGRFCIDRYEAPNVAGEKPLLMQSAGDGEAWCEERGKRLCLEREWVRACGGPSGWNYPYGITYRRSRCNDDKTYRVPRWAALRSWPGETASAEVARLDQSEPSGSRADCVSPEGVFDLTGNVAEWVVRTEDNPTNHDHVVKGCYWNQCYRPPHAPACDYVNYAHQGAERSYEMGFRCCRDRAKPAEAP